MLSLLFKIWLRYKKTMITSLKLHQIYFSKRENLSENSFCRSCKQLLQKMQTASTEVETVPAHSAVALVVVPKKSHKAYLTIFSQIMNLMPYTFLQANDVIRMISKFIT